MRRSIRLSLFLLAVSCQVVVAGVSVEYASQVDFSRYRSYSWSEGVVAPDPALEQTLHRAVDRELLAKGLKKVDQGGELLVRTRCSRREEQRSEVDILGERMIWEEGVSATGLAGEEMREVDMEVIAVELLDSHSKLLVWQGVLGAVAATAGGEVPQKRVEKLIGKMFRKYPPR